MAWTQTNRHLQLSSDNLDINNSLISDAHLSESLLGSTLPKSVWQIPQLMPNPRHYPSPYHHDQRAQSHQARQMALYCGYRYQLTLIHENAHLAIEDWIGQRITLTWGTQTSQIQTRHSIITEAASLGSNQGMAAYRIICEPALSQLRLNSHNRRHHHLSLSELIQDIFAPYDFDYQLNDALNAIHIQHSVQYNQTDLAYLTWQLSLHGITGYYQHKEDNHTLILIPHNHKALRPDISDITSQLTQNPASLADTQDRITALTPSTAHHISQTDLYRYDNRLTDHYTGSHQSEQGSEHPTAHRRFIHSHTRLNDEGLDKLATRIQQWHAQQAHSGSLEGNIRHLSIPSHHHISGNPYQSAPISISAIHHHINNHLPINWLGSAPFDPISLQPNPDLEDKQNQTDNIDTLAAQSSKQHENQSDENDQVHHITALYQPYPHNHHIPYGQMLNQLGQPHPSLTGLMSASIIADDAQSISNDRSHRAHIRYHWQTDDSTNPTSDDSAQWVPIASHLIADHMGQIHPLRHGQHVLIDFIGGDITQPVIIGSTHNGQGNDNAQHSRIASDTDYIDATSPTWFINPSHTYPIDGIKTQSIDSSRTGEANKDSGINGYNQLMFDQHPDHPQSQLYTTAHQSSLTLGSLHQHTDHKRGSARGQGISLETKAAGNLQGGTGIHITSHHADTHSHMTHMSHSRLQTADQQQQAYTQLAQMHQPVGLGVPPEASNEDSQTPFATFSEDTNSHALESGQWAQPHVLIDSSHNLALLTGQHSQLTSTQSSHSHAGDDTYYHSQTQLNQIVAGDIHYYSNKAQTHTAAHGDVSLQAHTDQMRLDSEQVLRIHSRADIEIIAPDTLSLKAAGSGIEISGGNVTLITPAQAGYKASKVDWGSGGGESKAIALQQMTFKACSQLANEAESNHAASSDLGNLKSNYSSNVVSKNYDKDGNFIDSHNIDDEPSNLVAGGFGGFTSESFGLSSSDVSYAQSKHEEWDSKSNKMAPKKAESSDSQKLPWTAKILPTAFPRVSSSMVKDEEYAALLKKRADMRNVSYAGAATAGYIPYAGITTAAGYIHAPAGITKTAVTSGTASSTLDAGSQMISDPKGDFNVQQSIGVGIVGAATGGYGKALSKGAGVETVSFTNLHKNTKNIPGLNIFANQQVLNQVGSRSVKSATNNESVSDSED